MSAQEIVPKLYLGDLKTAKDMKWLKKNKITHVLTILDDKGQLDKLQRIYTNNYQRSDNDPYVRHKIICVEDHPRASLDLHFSGCTAFIRTVLQHKRGRILVHCYHGISRSPTIVAAYLIEEYGMNSQDAMCCIYTKRQQVDPNIGFIHQLLSFAKTFRPNLLALLLKLVIDDPTCCNIIIEFFFSIFSST
jgi:protein-tyrosine phosphatase